MNEIPIENWQLHFRETVLLGQSYYMKEIHTVGGKKMVRTIDDLYLSGQSEHVQFEQL